MKRFLPIHPFLLAIFPVIFLFAHNMNEVSARDLILPVLAAIILTSILFFALRLVTRSYNKAGIITFFFLVLFYAYGYVRDLIRSAYADSPFDFGRALFLGSVWALLFIIGAFLVIKSRRNFATFTQFLNIVAIALMAISFINIGIFEIKTINPIQQENQEGNISNLKAPDNLPDIYYIILDAYARADTLSEIYHYDNSEFIDYLTGKGFYVASRSRSNYPGTIMSLPSSLNMEYPDILLDPSFDLYDPKSEAKLFAMLANNKVSQLLKTVEYQCIYVSTGFPIKDINKYADVYSDANEIIGLRLSPFTNHLISSTAIQPLVGPFINRESRSAILYGFDVLADMPGIKGPKFVFAHVNIPHPPWLFDRNGNPPLPAAPQPKAHPESLREIYPGAPEWYDKERYVDQLIFVNQKVEAVVDAILSKSRVAPIIILQGDHGPESYPYESGVSIDEGIKRQRDERMAILNAYFLPENGSRLLYESISPVNSFRVIFNLYFGGNFDLLQDDSYFLSFNQPKRKMILLPPESDAD